MAHRWYSISSLSIRTLVTLWAVSLVIGWTTLVGGWFLARRHLQSLGDQVARDVKALDDARQLETEILARHREDLLWKATSQAYHRELSNTHTLEAERYAVALGPYATTESENELLTQIRDKLKPIQQPSAASVSVEEEARPIYQLLDVVDTFQAENEAQMEDSMLAANHLQSTVSGSALVLSGFTTIVLLAGSFGLISRIIRPVLALKNAAAAFGRGDFAARSPILHDDELGTLAGTFNNMANDIAHREKDRLAFVAMVVHDLKNPAFALEMATRLLRGSKDDPEKHELYLNAMIDEATRLRLIVRDLTDDLQVASGRFSLRRETVDLCDLVRKLARGRAATAWDHQVVVEAEEECLVPADPARIERVVTNLVSNAIKYSPRKTRVTVRVQKRQSSAVLSVSDQGMGIEKEDMKMLFQPFGRGRSAAALAEGVGIGLYVVKQIVEAHGGRVEVESEPGHGATFRVMLPLANG